jgi:hypothetical protein
MLSIIFQVRIKRIEITLCFHHINFSERKNLSLSFKEFCTTDRIGIKNERFDMDAEGIIRTTAEICKVGWLFDGGRNGMCKKI